VQLLTIKAGTRASGLVLYNTLQEFHPELDTDEAGDCFVAVGLVGDRRVRGVFDAIHDRLGPDLEIDSMTLDDGTRFDVPTNGRGTTH
jgi:hypothetical protein